MQLIWTYFVGHSKDVTNWCFNCLQVLGALWYLLSIQREDTCWREACGNHNGCESTSLYCGSDTAGNNTFIKAVCPTNGTANPDPIFGIYLPALQNVSQSTSFFEKLFYCFWWGLQNLRFVRKKINFQFIFYQRMMKML